MKEILLNLTKEQLIIIGVVLIGLLALLVSTGGGVVNRLKDKYGIDNRAITINRDNIELKEDREILYLFQ